MNATTVHPLIAGILDATQRSQRLAAYLHDLQVHDWWFERSDDGTAWRAGRAERARLDRVRAEIDPDGALWNSIAPEAFRVGKR